MPEILLARLQSVSVKLGNLWVMLQGAAASWGTSWEVVLWSRLGGLAVSGTSLLLGLSRESSHDSAGASVLVLRLSFATADGPGGVAVVERWVAGFADDNSDVLLMTEVTSLMQWASPLVLAASGPGSCYSLLSFLCRGSGAWLWSPGSTVCTWV